MILPVTKKILIVPDFGVSAQADDMVAIKTAIEAKKEYSVMIADLPSMVTAENAGHKLTDSQVIELSARRLETLAADDTIVWDNCDDDTPDYDPLHVDPATEHVTTDEPATEDEYKQKIIKRAFRLSSLKITKSARRELNQGSPDVIVVFGKSAMLAGGVKDKEILFINPQYDSEWPWKKQYYADRDAAAEFMAGFVKEFNKPSNTYVHWDGPEVNHRSEPTMRFALITNENAPGQFGDRYPNLAVVDKVTESETEYSARQICQFTDHNLPFDMLDIYRLIRDANWQTGERDFCTFATPLKAGGLTLLGLTRGVPMANNQSGIKVRTKELTHPMPLEVFTDRKDVATIKTAITYVIENLLPAKKRILIVPDYFTPYDAPSIAGLRESLQQMGYYVAVFAAGNSIERSRIGIERRCKKRPFDLIVTLESGCLLAARITNAPRIFVNPDWTAWRRMAQRLGKEKERIISRGNNHSGPFFSYYLNIREITEAQKMSERSYIRRNGQPTIAWFTDDMRDCNRPDEHMQRFNTAGFPPIMNLTNPDNIVSLATEINKYFTNQDDN